MQDKCGTRDSAVRIGWNAAVLSLTRLGFAQGAPPQTMCECEPTLYADSTNSVSVCVCPMMLPLITATAPNSPMARCRRANVTEQPSISLRPCQ